MDDINRSLQIWQPVSKTVTCYYSPASLQAAVWRANGLKLGLEFEYAMNRFVLNWQDSMNFGSLNGAATADHFITYSFTPHRVYCKVCHNTDQTGAFMALHPIRISF